MYVSGKKNQVHGGFLHDYSSGYGIEGPCDGNPSVMATRMRQARNLLVSLLFSQVGIIFLIQYKLSIVDALKAL